MLTAVGIGVALGWVAAIAVCALRIFWAIGYLQGYDRGRQQGIRDACDADIREQALAAWADAGIREAEQWLA